MKKKIVLFLLFSLWQSLSLAQGNTAYVYIGLYNQTQITGIPKLLNEITIKYDTYRIYVSNSAYPRVLRSKEEITDFLEFDLSTINPTLPQFSAEINNLLHVDSEVDMLNFDDSKQPRVRNKTDFYFILPETNLEYILRHLVIEYLIISGFGDVDDFWTNVDVYIFTNLSIDQEPRIQTSLNKIGLEHLQFKTY